MRDRARHAITCQIAVLEILYGGLDASESLRFLPPLQALARSVYMRFSFDQRWTVDITNQFTQQCVRTLHFTDPEKVRDIAQRGKALPDLSSKND